MSLDQVSRQLVEFQRIKYEEVDVPGQLMLARDLQEVKEFPKIERFQPTVNIVRKVRFLIFFRPFPLCLHFV